jgi:hypothetical protein
MGRVALASVGVALSVLASPLSAYAAEASGPWIFVHLKDSMTDVVQERAYVKTNGSTIRITCLPASPEIGLVIEFIPAQNLDSLYFTRNVYGGKDFKILMRFDDGSPMESTWNIGRPIGGNLLRFFDIRRAASSSAPAGPSLDVLGLFDLISSSKRIRMRSKSDQNFDFDVTGAPSTIKKLKRMCNISA